MTHLYGEYECKLDPKGRLKMPAQLLRQLTGRNGYTFYMNRGFEKNIVLYPDRVWEEITSKVGELNYYNLQERQFMRYFFRGVKDVETDSADRILVGKPLLDYAGIKSDVVLFAFIDKIEIWDKDTYYNQLEQSPEDFAALADRIFGDSRNELKE
jgi:MraZ protein